jgi:hypothetical protein
MRIKHLGGGRGRGRRILGQGRTGQDVRVSRGLVGCLVGAPRRGVLGGKKGGEGGRRGEAGEQGRGAAQFSFSHAGLSPILYCYCYCSAGERDGGDDHEWCQWYYSRG